MKKTKSHIFFGIGLYYYFCSSVHGEISENWLHGEIHGYIKGRSVEMRPFAKETLSRQDISKKKPYTLHSTY